MRLARLARQKQSWRVSPNSGTFLGRAKLQLLHAIPYPPPDKRVRREERSGPEAGPFLLLFSSPKARAANVRRVPDIR